MSNFSPFIKVLFLEANREDATHLRINQEIRDIKEVLRSSKLRDRIEVNQLGAVRTEDFTKELLEYKPRIVHFSGHGERSTSGSNATSSQQTHREMSDKPKETKDRTREISDKPEEEWESDGRGGLIFEDKKVTSTDIENFFTNRESPVDCVVLNSCYSEELSEEVTKYVRYAIGMKQAIKDEDAIKFAKNFYRGFRSR